MIAQINDIKIGYEEWGEGDRSVVLIHGFGLDRTIWREVAKQIADVRVILPDVRGHGESDAPDGPYPMSLLASDLAGLLDLLEIDKAVVCGHSMGGYITLAFAAQFPEQLAGLGLITTRAAADSAEKRAGRYELVESVRERGSMALAETLAPRLSHDPDIVQATYEMIAETAPRGIIGTAMGMAERPDRRALLDELALPALVVAGSEDQIIDIEDARGMAGRLPKGQFQLIDGAGHMPMWEKPMLLSRTMAEFLF
ncbi:alpha/beta hydrolase [bacterium]|nr:alpha/beta hydrolase [bacterium]